jgi:Flp pilus assembly protein TadG
MQLGECFEIPAIAEKAMWGRVNLSLKSAWKRFSRSCDGAAAVEFALVAGPFIFVLGCICETGLMLFSEYVLQNSVQDAARLVRTGQTSKGDGTVTLSASDFKTTLCAQVSIILDCANKVTVYVNSASNFAALSGLVGSPLNIGPSAGGAAYPLTYNPGGQLQAGAVVASYDWKFTFPFMNFLGNLPGDTARRIYGIAIFRNEPFS